MTIYDPSTAPARRVGFDDVMATIRGRLHLAPLFREKLLRVPMDLDHPYWVDDADFDVTNHVHRVHLRPPADWAALCAQTAEIVARPLD